jgi:6-phosphogluconolactonase/glucosamine-6-phosphate isomerase/deaminase
MGLQFIKSVDPKIGEINLYQILSAELEHKKVLWIVSGGSNVPISVSVMKKLSDQLTKNLIIILADERYGPEGHPDSNFEQLIKAGFDQKQATFYKTLIGKQSISQTISRTGQYFKRAVNETDVVIAQLGIGEDGHIAGIMPMSPVIGLVSDVVYSDTTPHKRISLSLEALLNATIVYAFCYGGNKHQALKDLKENIKDIYHMPSKILQDISSVYVYNDYLGDS